MSKVINRQDGRYVRSERKILNVFKRAMRQRKYGVKIMELCRKGGYALSTFRRHYRSVNEILIEQEQMIWRDFVVWWRRFVTEHAAVLNRNEVRTQGSIAHGAAVRLSGDIYYRLFWRWLIFLMQSRQHLDVLVATNDWLIIEKMLRKMNLVTEVNMEIFDVYVGEVLVILRRWQMEKYQQEELEKHVKQLTHLAKTADWRLRELKK